LAQRFEQNTTPNLAGIKILGQSSDYGVRSSDLIKIGTHPIFSMV